VLDLTPEQLLTTTRAVRRRLDVDRPVDRETIRHCLSIATQAPTSVNLQNWHFVVVTDATVRAGVAEWYRRAWQDYSSTPLDEDPPGEASGAASSRHLARIMPRVPVLLIPCIEGRPEGQASGELAALYGSRGGRAAGHPLRRRHPGGAVAGGPHHGRRLPAGAETAAGRRRALGRLVVSVEKGLASARPCSRNSASVSEISGVCR
jgi:hypothetical protein